MKNYTNPSPKRRSYKNTSLNLSQSLFMDETSADLENYLNSSLPESSSVAEQELECSTINALSKSIKGKFQKSSSDSKKNKFFKSKSSDDKIPVNSSEIPVINEAMKKILKETSYEPNLKHSPKVLKTYSNKHKDKAQIVESFGLPDEPILSVDPSYPKEQDTIDLHIEPENNLNNSLIFGQWIPSLEVQSSGITINDDFERKSFSAIDTVLFGATSLETDNKEEFNCEEDKSVQDALKHSNEENSNKKNENPVVLMKSLNLNDILLLETNNLSPSKNRRKMLLDRWKKFNSKLKHNENIQRSRALHKSQNLPGIGISKANSRRSTRSNTSNIELDGCGNNSTKNADNPEKLKFQNSAGKRASELEDKCSPVINEEKHNKYKINEENHKTFEETNQKIPQNIDIVSPRRITRRSVQQTVDSLPVSISNELCSLNFKSLSGINKCIVECNPTLADCKRGKRSSLFQNSVEHENEKKTRNSLTKPVQDDVIANKPPENLIDVISPSNLRNVRDSLRSSNSSTKLENKIKSSPHSEHKLNQNSTNGSKKKRNTIQKKFKSSSEKIQSSGISKKVDNSFISALDGCVRISNDGDEISTDEHELNISNKGSSSSKNKILSSTANLDSSHEGATLKRKSNRLKLYADENFKHLNQSVEEYSINEDIPMTKNKIVKLDMKSPVLQENEKFDENLKTLSIEEVPYIQVKKSKGRSFKKKTSDIQDKLDLLKTLEEVTHKSSAHIKLAQNEILISVDKITKIANDNDISLEITEINNISQLQSNEENIPNIVNTIEENLNETTDSAIIIGDNNISDLYNKETTKRKRGRPKKNEALKQDNYESKNNTYINEKRGDESIQSTDSEVVDEEHIIPNLDYQEPIKRERGRSKKNMGMKENENEFEINTCMDKKRKELNGDQDEDKIIENDSGVNNGTLMFNNKEKTQNYAKEGSREQEVYMNSLVLQDDNSTKTKEHINELQFCESNENTLAMEKKNCDQSVMKDINGKKIKLHDEFQMSGSFQNTDLDDKTEHVVEDSDKEIFHYDKFGSKFEIDQKTTDITTETTKVSTLGHGNENNQVCCNSIDDKNFNEKKVVNSLNNTQNGSECVTDMKVKDSSIITVEYSDFGYDIHRRTSFRKILEKVMEVSRSEMEMAKSDTKRDKRCKSVPPEEFHRNVETNYVGVKSASADSKLKYLKDKKNSYANTDISNVKKCLDYVTQSRFPSRKRTKSVHVVSRRLSIVSNPPQAENSGHSEEEKSSKNGIISIFNVGVDKDTKEIKKPEIFVTNENMNNGTQKKLQDDEISTTKQSYEPDSRLSIDSSRKYITDHEDLEVENLLLEEISSKGSYERIRSKSFSESKSRQKFYPRTKSVQGRRFRKRNRTYTSMSGSTETVKKVYEFKVGDSVWGRVGKYPYWPGLVMEDPETSDFKKFRLLRTTPYYHIRFFGDNGKRAWTSYCIPYKGSQDLDILREQFPKEGSQNDYHVKAAYLEKWNKAVQEAEMVKKYSLEKKFEFFDKILPSKERTHISEDTDDILVEDSPIASSKSFRDTASTQETSYIKSGNNTLQKGKIPMKVSSLINCIESVVNNYTEISSQSECTVPKSRNRNISIKDAANSVKNVNKTSTNKKTDESPTKRSIPMKDSSVLACIDDVVNKFCSPSVHNIDENSRKRKTRDSKKRTQVTDSDIDIGLELLDIPVADLSKKIDMKSTEQNTFCKSPEQSTSSGTPLSSRRASVISPTRTRSRSSLKLDKRRLSDEFKHDGELPVSSQELKADDVLSCSPRRLKLKRRTIEIGRNDTDSETSANSFLNDVTSWLPEYKKNLFRGVTKEKVCQICEKPGDVVKCRGPCNGDFHIKCVENSLKETDELTLKEQGQFILKEELDIPNSQLNDSMDDDKQVEISTVMSRKKFTDTVVLSPINRKIPLMEQFDRKMKELMSQVESRISIDSNDTSSEEIDTFENISVNKKPNGKNSKKIKGLFKHVTADDVSVINLSDADATKLKDFPSEIIEQSSTFDEGIYKCSFCTSTVIPPCFVCNSVVSKTGNTMRQRCSLQKCGRYYHLECLNVWHQTQWSFILHDKKKSEALDSFVCPRHSCHICASENLGFSMGRCPNDKLVKCLRCPATYHNSYHCVPAGTEILTSTQIICPRHVEANKKSNTLNTIWCFVCSEGGNLICCETCPTSVHSECLPVNLLDDDTYICEDCESGRFPLYDEVVWVKCGTFRWWPAIILFPNEVPANVESKPHKKGEFVVKFFGTYNYFWVGRGRVFLYQEGDTGYLNNTKNKIDEAFSRAIKEAADVYNFKKGLRAKKHKEVNNGLKPPPYVRIKVNRPVGNVRVFEGNLSNTTPCDCNPKDKSPCGPNSNCLNRILLTECNPEICPAGDRCKNQSFEKREYPQIKPYRTAGRGWGLKALEPLKKGQFVIEYVGEIIDDEEYQRRITRMHQQKDENYYFLTIDKDRMLDAGPKGNAARFMNHSCNPNCETQKWTVNGDTRVGLFALENISVDTELTFNYNLECAGTEKKICRCGAPNCSGFIGLKPEDQRSSKKHSTAKLVEQDKSTDTIVNDTCFICGQPGDVGKCTHKSCLNSYHLECVQLDSWPKGKWKCPSHTCNVCSKTTARICVLCNNSYCSNHLEGNIRLDDTMGYLCSQHDQTRKKSTRRRTAGNLHSSLSSSPNTSGKKNSVQNEKSESLRSERYRKRTTCFDSNIPPKKMKLND